MAKMNKNINRLVIEKPVVGGSVDVWGNIINKDLDNIGAFADEVATKMDTHDQELANLKNDKVSKNEVEATITPIVNNYVENTVKPSLDAYEKEKEQELDTFKETKTTEITAHADKEKERITTEINNVAGTAKQSVTNEGTKQTGLVIVESNKVIEQVKALVEGNPATTNALTLSNKTRPEFEKEVQGVIGEYEGTFPLTSAVQNKVYYIPTIGKYYRCKTAYNGTQLTMPNGNFEEISTSINSDKIGNLARNFIKVNINGMDLNTILKEGIYYAVFKNNCLNIPIADFDAEFLLIVFELSSAIKAYKIQIFIDCTTKCETYIRGWNYSENTYGPWKKFNLADIR